MAGVDRRRRRDPGGRRRPHRRRRAWRAELVRHADRPLKIGSFSAASNVTGIVTDTAPRSPTCCTARRARRSGTSPRPRPYVDIDMNPGCAEHPLAYKDAIFLSPHKFIGGPGTPGCWCVRRELLTNRVPDVVGGGTVAYVNPTEHVYLTDPVHREEGGTPAIVESIRAGLVFQLKEAVGVDAIRAHEDDYVRRAMAAWDAARRPSRSSATATPSGCRSCRSSCAGRAAATCTTTSSSRCSTTCSASSPAAAARAPGRTATGCSASTSSARTSSSARSRTAARASSRAGCGSTSTTSSPRRCSGTSSTRSRWSPTTAGRCCRTTASTRRPGLWRHRAGPVEPPLRLADVGYDADGVLRYPAARRDGAGDRAGRLPRGGAGVAAPTAPEPADDRARRACPPTSRHLRWFDLPAVCLS